MKSILLWLAEYFEPLGYSEMIITQVFEHWKSIKISKWLNITQIESIFVD